MKPTQEQSITLTSDNVKTIQTREVEIEFTEWLHPQMGVIQVDPKTPLVLRAKIREEM